LKGSQGICGALSRRAVVMLLAALAASSVHAGAEEARAWITRMNGALATSSYDGVFVHQMGERREVLRIVHRVQDGHMAERVASTDGSGREFLRNGSKWVAFYPDQRIALVQTRNRSYGFLIALNVINANSERFYQISDAGPTRLQGREAQQILLEPRDALRYGYRFWLDTKTALPLKSQLVSRSGEVIEEIAFINLTLPEKVADELLKPELDTTGFRWLRRDVPMHNPDVKISFVPRAELLPAGFRVRMITPPEEEAKAQGPRTRFIVSDGVAWASVFIEKGEKSEEMLRKDGGPPPGLRPDGVVMMGASAVYVAPLDGYRVTVVGEVPPATVKAIAEAVRPE
jgi:sigma-E factor negative regulatory protein RseB